MKRSRDGQQEHQRKQRGDGWRKQAAGREVNYSGQCADRRADQWEEERRLSRSDGDAGRKPATSASCPLRFFFFSPY